MSRKDPEDEIVASGEALQVVAGWLGISDAAQALQEEPEGQDFTQPRPQGLGLGAKYLPHHKGVLLTAGVQQRLGSKLRQSRERGKQHSDAAASGAMHSHKRPHAGGKGAPAAAGRGGREPDSGDSSDESEGRGAAFASKAAPQQAEQQTKAQQPQQRRQQQQHKPVGFSRQDLLGTAGQQGSGGSRKKKKHKAAAAGGS